MSKVCGPLSFYVLGDEDNAVWFYPGDEVPDWAVKLAADHVFEGSKTPEPYPEILPSGPPPSSGKGSGRDAWADYALRKCQGVVVSDDMSRDDIIAACANAGYTV